MYNIITKHKTIENINTIQDARDFIQKSSLKCLAIQYSKLAIKLYEKQNEEKLNVETA